MAEKIKKTKKAVKKPEKKKGVKKALAKKTAKKVVKKAKSKEQIRESAEQDKKYYEAVGRRKRAIARVRLFTCRPFEGDIAKITVNGKDYQKFFSTLELRNSVDDPLKKMKSLNRFEATVKVVGGGIRGQAEAIRHGLARALVLFNPDFTKKLKRAGFLKRDPRKIERKKPGLRKARRAPQWKKR